MRVHVATAGNGRAHDGARLQFGALAEADAIGHHTATDDPDEADVILFVDLHQLPADPWLRALRRHPLVAAFRDKARVYDERDAPFATFPGIYVSATTPMAAGQPIVGGPFASLHRERARAADPPRLLFSFRGTETHTVRRRAFALSHPRAIVEEIDSRSPVVPGSTDRAAYDALIDDSKFVLCPRGHGASSFRLYEAMQAGRVPVIISDAFLPPPGIDWTSCSVRVRERDVADIPILLERLEGDWPQLSANAAGIFDTHFAYEALWNYYVESLARLELARRPWIPWWASGAALRVGVRQARVRARRRLRSGIR